MLPLVLFGKCLGFTFGYEIGYFFRRGNQYHTYLIDAKEMD
jgi:hypothetical protein